MIPIISLSTLVTLVFGVFTVIRFNSLYKKTNDIKLYYLYKAFLFLSFGMVLLSLPGVLVKNLKIIDLAYDIYPLFFVISQAYFISITFNILGAEKARKVVFFLMAILGLVISVFPAINMASARVGTQGPFIFWEDTRGDLMNILLGLAMTVPSLWFVFFFLWNGITAQDGFIRRRAFLMSAGMVSWVMLGLTDYIFGAFLGTISLSVVTVLFAYIFFTCFLIAIYRKEQKVNQIQQNI